MKNLIVVYVCAGLVFVGTSRGASRSIEAPATPLQDRPVPTTGSRQVALARAYMQIDQLVAAHPLTGEQLIDINRRFDEASLMFFTGRQQQALEVIEALVAEILNALPEVEANQYRLAWRAESDAAHTDVDVTNSFRDEATKRLQHIETTQTIRRESVEVFRQRLALLQARGGATDLSRLFFTDAALIAELRREIERMERGNDPYAGRTGHLWRTLTHQDLIVPMRVYMPVKRLHEDPIALIIALHGAGGNEHMFMEAYGSGVIGALADTHDCLIVSPLTYPLAGDVTIFDSLLNEITACYRIDADRIYVIGHSLGAAAALGIASARSDQIAAVCCIAGGGVPRSKEIPPTLVISAELDGLAGAGSAERTATAANRARSQGASIEHRTMNNWGHTLVVGAALPEAVQWLLSHTRATSTTTPLSP